MTAAFIDRTRSRAAFDEIARPVAGGESNDPLGRWFVSLAHGPAEIEATLVAVRGAVEDLAR